MKASLYLDEDTMATALVVALRARGADIQTFVDAGLRGKEDGALLEWAASNKRTLYIQRAGFLQIAQDISTVVKNTLASLWFHANATTYPIKDLTCPQAAGQFQMY
ncbi:MAG TPA: DUF5615 family PIN-like protein [Terriglobia bacterium]